MTTNIHSKRKQDSKIAEDLKVSFTPIDESLGISHSFLALVGCHTEGGNILARG